MIDEYDDDIDCDDMLLCNQSSNNPSLKLKTNWPNIISLPKNTELVLQRFISYEELEQIYRYKYNHDYKSYLHEMIHSVTYDKVIDPKTWKYYCSNTFTSKDIKFRYYSELQYPDHKPPYKENGKIVKTYVNCKPDYHHYIKGGICVASCYYQANKTAKGFQERYPYGLMYLGIAICKSNEKFDYTLARNIAIEKLFRLALTSSKYPIGCYIFHPLTCGFEYDNGILKNDFTNHLSDYLNTFLNIKSVFQENIII
jgi:hypothetical protein